MYSEFAGSAISVFYIGCPTRWDAPEECYEKAKQLGLNVADPLSAPGRCECDCPVGALIVRNTGKLCDQTEGMGIKVQGATPKLEYSHFLQSFSKRLVRSSALVVRFYLSLLVYQNCRRNAPILSKASDPRYIRGLPAAFIKHCGP
jgi:hypothetical protein